MKRPEFGQTCLSGEQAPVSQLAGYVCSVPSLSSLLGPGPAFLRHNQRAVRERSLEWAERGLMRATDRTQAHAPRAGDDREGQSLRGRGRVQV